MVVHVYNSSPQKEEEGAHNRATRERYIVRAVSWQKYIEIAAGDKVKHRKPFLKVSIPVEIDDKDLKAEDADDCASQDSHMWTTIQKLLSLTW